MKIPYLEPKEIDVGGDPYSMEHTKERDVLLEGSAHGKSCELKNTFKIVKIELYMVH